MTGGSIFAFIFVIWMNMGFFNANTLDELTINLNLNESPKGDEQDEAHDYGNAGAPNTRRITTTDSCLAFDIHHLGNALDKPGGDNNYGATGSAKGCQSLCQKTAGCAWFNWERKEDVCWLKTGKGNKKKKMPGDVSGPRDCYTGNKPSAQKTLFSKGNFTKKIKENIFDSAKNLTQLIKFAADDLVPPEIQNYMNNLYQEIEMIYSNIVEWMANEEKTLINRIYTRMVKSHTDLHFLRQTLKILAKETISRSNRIIKLFKKLKQDNSKRNMKVLQLSAKKMKRLLERSYGILEDAIKEFKKIVDNVNLVKVDMNHLIKEIQKMDDEENVALQEWISKKRLEVYGGSAACAAALAVSVIVCPITYATAAAILEPIINKEKAKFKQLQLAATEAENNAKRLFDKINEKEKYVRVESKLIAEWKSHISMVEDDLIDFDSEDTEDVEMFLELDEDKEAIDNLCNLTKACKDYIDHHMPGLEIVSPPLHADCTAARSR